MPLMLQLENVSLFVGSTLLLDDANFSINPGDRVGIVGRNGSGKTHLMKLLAGEITPDSGSRKLVNDQFSVCLVKQELPDDDQSPLDYLRAHDPDIQALEDKIDESDANHLAEIYERIAELDEDRYEVLAPKVLMGLGLTHEELRQPMRNLSGGLRMRISLSLALIRTPSILLLDEPTNHLDLESTVWLIEYLKNYPISAAFVIVTHDEKLIDEVTNTTMHLRAGVLTKFGGRYRDFREDLRIREEKDIQRNNDLDKQINQKMKIYYQFRDLPESRAAQAVSQKKRADKLKGQKVDIIVDEPVPTFELPEPSELINPVVELTQVVIGYDQKPVLKNLDLSISYGARIGLLGRNGEGKSSLIKALAGKLDPMSGQLYTRQGLKVGYFSQNLEDELDPSLTVLQQFKTTPMGRGSVENCRSSLSPFGLGSQKKLSTLVGDLSGGEKSKLLFALICANSPNLLILDEPTNHLDLETREALVKAIANFKGAIILVSHDWDFHEKTMNEFWLAEGGTVKPYQKGLAHYHRGLVKLYDNPASSASKAAKEPAVSKDNARHNMGLFDGKIPAQPKAKKQTHHSPAVSKRAGRRK